MLMVTHKISDVPDKSNGNAPGKNVRVTDSVDRLKIIFSERIDTDVVDRPLFESFNERKIHIFFDSP